MSSVLVRGLRVSGLISKLSNHARLTLASTSRYSLKNNNLFTLPHVNGIQRPLSYLHNSLFSSVKTASDVQDEEELNIDKDATIESESLQKIELNTKRKREGRGKFITSKIGFLKSLERKLTEGEMMTSQTAFLLLKSCGRHMENENNSSRTELVKHVWEELGKKGVQRNTALWNTLLSVHNENRHELDPLLFLKNMWDVSNAEPNRSTFSLLVASYALRGDAVGAMKIVEFMMQNGGRLTEDVYAWIIFAFAKNGDTDGVNEILASMEESGLKPKQTTYGLLINAQAERGDIEGIDKTIKEMIERSFYPTTLNYLDMLKHLVVGGHSELIDAIMERINNIDGLRDDLYSLIQYCVTNGNYESALKLLLILEKQTGSKNGYKFHIGNMIFQKFYYARKNPEDYLEMVSLLDQHLIPEGSSNHYNLIKFLIARNMTDEAFKVLQFMLSEGNDRKTLDYLCTLLLQKYADSKEIPKLLQFVKCMIDNGVQPSYFNRNIIGSAINASSSDENSLFLEELKGLGMALPDGQLRKLCEADDVKLDTINDAVSNSKDFELFNCLKDIKNLLMSDFNSPEAITLVLNLDKRGAKLWGCIEDIIEEKAVDQDGAKEVLQFVMGVVNENYVISSHIYTKMLATLYVNNLVDDFFSFIRLMKVHGVDPNTHQHYQMLKMASKVGNSIAAKYCFERIKDEKMFKNETLYHFLILAHFKDRGTQRGNEESLTILNLFNEMVEKGYEPYNSTISIVLESLFIAKDIERAEKIMKEYSVKADNLKFDHFYLAVHVSRNEFTEAEQLFQKLKDNSSIQVRHYNELMKMSKFSGDTAKIEELYQDMSSSGITPNVHTQIHRIRTYLAAKKPEHCVDIIEEYVSKGNKDMHIGIMMEVLQLLHFTGNTAYVLKMINIIEEHHPLSVSQNRFNTYMILTHIKAGELEKAASIFKSDQETESDEELQLDAYRKAAQIAASDGDIDYLEKIIDFMKVNNLHYPDLDMFYLLALDEVDNVEHIKSFYEERMRNDVPFTNAFLDTLQGMMAKRDIPNFIVRE